MGEKIGLHTAYIKVKEAVEELANIFSAIYESKGTKKNVVEAVPGAPRFTHTSRNEKSIYAVIRHKTINYMCVSF